MECEAGFLSSRWAEPRVIDDNRIMGEASPTRLWMPLVRHTGCSHRHVHMDPGLTQDRSSKLLPGP